MYKISFIVIVYNLKEYIKRCIKSIQNQTLKDIEIIIVDNGSSDGTDKIIKEIASTDTRVKIESFEENRSQNEARKKGYLSSTGEFIAFIDGDDYIDNYFAEKLFSIAKYEHYDIVCCNYYMTYNNESKNYVHSDNIYEDINEYKFLELLLEQKITHSLWNKLFKRKIIEETINQNICKAKVGEDLAYNILIALSKPKVKMIKEAYYYYYQRNNSIMRKVNINILDIDVSLKYIENILKKEGLYEKYGIDIEYLWFTLCYLSKIIFFQLKPNIKYQKKFYIKWKAKKIDITKNNLCMEYMNKFNKNTKFIKKMFDINFYLGMCILNIRYILKKV